MSENEYKKEQILRNKVIQLLPVKAVARHTALEPGEKEELIPVQWLAVCANGEVRFMDLSKGEIFPDFTDTSQNLVEITLLE